MAGKGKGGRPSKYNSDITRQAEILYRKGFTDAEVAEVVNVDERTINNWKDSKPEFFQSLKASKDSVDDEVEQSLFKRAKGFEHGDKHYPPSEVACIFWLKNRRPDKWRDKHELVGKDDTPLVPVINFGKK